MGVVTKISIRCKILDVSPMAQFFSALFSNAWLVGWLFGFNGPLRQYFSLYRAVSQREVERGEKG